MGRATYLNFVYRMQENFGGEKVWLIKTTGRLAEKNCELKTTCNFDLAKAPPIDSRIHNGGYREYMQRKAIQYKRSVREPIKT